jgi:hypothetical protein
MRAAATTAVVAGTAGAVRHHQEQKYAAQDSQAQAQAQAQYQAAQDQAYAAGMAAAQQAPAVEPAAPLEVQLKELGDLHTAGLLTDEEFASAKKKILGL